MFNLSKNVLRAVIKLSFATLVSVLVLTVCVSIAYVASQVISFEVGPTHVQQVTPGQAIVYKHVLTNTGTLTDTFLVDVLSTQDWPVELIGEGYLTGTALLPIEVSSQMTASFQVSLTVPLGAAGVTEITIITATSQISPTVLDTTTDTSIVLNQIYLPLVLKRWPPIPYKPSLNAIQDADDGDYTVDWNELTSSLADTYILQEATDATFTDNLRVVCTTAQQSCIINGKLAGTYYYRVRGQNSWGDSEWSNIQISNVLLPNTPTLNVIENADGDGHYSITWGATAYATSYVLEEATNSTFGDAKTLYSGTEQYWSVSNQPYGTYYYRVAAIGPTGQSEWSDVQSVDVPAPSPGVSVLNNHTTYESGSYLYVVGEVYNNTASYLRFVKIVANFYDGTQLVETDYTYTHLDDLHPYEKTCFMIMLSNPSMWTHYTFEPVSYWTDGAARPNLTITTHSGGVYSSYYRILGQIRNDESQQISFVSAVATLYSNTGQVLDCDYSYVNSTDLNPGQVSSFEMLANPSTPSAVEFYTLQTDGNW